MRAHLRLAALVLILLPACRTYLPYTPTPMASQAEAMRTIRQTLEEQRNEYAVREVDVAADRFRVVQARDSAKEIGVSVYYARIGKLVLSKRKTVYAVSIYGTDDAFLLHVYAYDAVSAERFIDALDTMRAASTPT